MKEWTICARQICQRTAAEHPQATGAELRRIFRDAYPWGQRKYWPYKAWLKACRREINRRDGKVEMIRPRASETRPTDPRQLDIFGGAA